jgi:hypothetical protein
VGSPGSRVTGVGKVYTHGKQPPTEAEEEVGKCVVQRGIQALRDGKPNLADFSSREE